MGTIKTLYCAYPGQSSREGDPDFLFKKFIVQFPCAEYDLNGNLLRPGFIYDEFDQLVQTGTDCYLYDALGRRLSSEATSYFYVDDEEIGSFENGKIQELKVMGTDSPISVEIKEKPFATVVDVQNTIRKLA